MTTVLEFLLAGLIGWVASALLLDLYESARPPQKIEENELEYHKKGIQRAMNILSLKFGLLTALVWLVLYHWRNISN